MSDIFGLDSYVIGRPNTFSLNVAYDCYDKDGTKLIEVKKKFIGEAYTLTDPSKKIVGEIHRKYVAITPTYELYDDNKKVIGYVSKEINIAGNVIAGAQTFLLEDADKNKIATLTLTAPLMQLFTSLIKKEQPNTISNIVSMDGSKTIAQVGFQQSTSIRFTPNPNYAIFVLSIQDKTTPTLLLIEFAIAVEHLYTSSIVQGGQGGFRLGNAPGFGGNNPGFGGGGINIGL
jgi:hypothetical protein